MKKYMHGIVREENQVQLAIAIKISRNRHARVRSRSKIGQGTNRRGCKGSVPISEENLRRVTNLGRSTTTKFRQQIELAIRIEVAYRKPRSTVVSRVLLKSSVSIAQEQVTPLEPARQTGGHQIEFAVSVKVGGDHGTERGAIRAPDWRQRNILE